MSEDQTDMDSKTQELWDLVVDIYKRMENMCNFQSFEADYGKSLDNLGIRPNLHVGDERKPGYVISRRYGIEWYLGQIRNISLESSFENPAQYIEKFFHLKENNDLYFSEKRFIGEDIAEIFKSVDRDNAREKELFAFSYSVENAWHESHEFPGKMIFTDFFYADRNSYEGVSVAMLVKPVHPDESFVKLEGTVSKPYVVLDENGRVGSIFEVRKVNGETVEINGNDVVSFRAKECGENRYAKIVSELKDQGFIKFNRNGEIPADSELAVITGDLEDHGFCLKRYMMENTQTFSCGGNPEFAVVQENGLLGTFNMNDMDDILYVKNN